MKKVLWMITAGVTLLAGLYLLLVATAPAKTTHHAETRVELFETGGPPERKVAEYEQIVAMLDAWAGRVGLSRVPPGPQGDVRRAAVNTSTSARERVTYFRETNAKDPSWPIEVIIIFNPDLAPVVTIAMTEGYGRRPSAKLESLHGGLQEQLREHYGNKIVSSKVW